MRRTIVYWGLYWVPSILGNYLIIITIITNKKLLLQKYCCPARLFWHAEWHRKRKPEKFLGFKVYASGFRVSQSKVFFVLVGGGYWFYIGVRPFWKNARYVRRY